MTNVKKQSARKRKWFMGILIAIPLLVAQTARGEACPAHPGAPNPDETAECTGNVSLGVPLLNTDLILYYHSIPSSLDNFYARLNRSGDFLGKGWRFLNDASVFFDPSGSRATVVLGDGSAISYEKDSQNIYWPSDRRVTKSYLFFDGGTLKRNLSDGSRMSFGVQDSAGVYHLTKLINPAGRNALLFARSADGRINQISGYGFNGATLSYESTTVSLAGHTLTVTEGFLRQISFPTPAESVPLVASFKYENQQLTSYTDKMERTTTISYWTDARVRRIIDPSNFSTSYRYTADLAKFYVTVKSLSGTTVQAFSGGRLDSISDAESGSQVRFIRNAQGRVTSKIQYGQTTVYVYSSSPPAPFDFLPSRITMPDGLSFDLEYEGNTGWRLLSKQTITGPNGIPFVTSFVYDNKGRLKNKSEGSARYVYGYQDSTSGGVLNSVTLNGKNLISATYDGNLNLQSMTDQSNIVTSMPANAAGLPSSLTNSYGSTTIGYDSLNRPTSFSSAEGTRTLGYGTIGNIASDTVNFPSGGTKSWTRTLKFKRQIP
jgi:hypothetical protein